MFFWTQWEVLLPLIFGIFGLGLFVYWSAQSQNETILPKSMFRVPTALASYLGTVVHGMILWSSVYYLVKHLNL